MLVITMQIVTIGPKYQIVIPKKVREEEKTLQPGSKVMVGRTKEGTITVKPIRKNWSDEHYGAFKKYWKGTDPAAEVEKMRDEWEERLEELEQIRQGKNPYGKNKQV